MSEAETRTRREVLTGRLTPAAPPECHVSSLIVHVRPEKSNAAVAALRAIPGVEVHAEAAGKVIITLETDNESDIVTRLNEISLLDGVMSAALVFHHFEAAESVAPTLKDG